MDVGVGACKSTVFHFIWVTNTFVWLMEMWINLSVTFIAETSLSGHSKSTVIMPFTETPKRKYFYSHERLLSSLNEKGETTHSSATWKMSLLVDLIKCHPLNIFHLLVLQIFWRAVKIQCTWNWATYFTLSLMLWWHLRSLLFSEVNLSAAACSLSM